jgi:hypothetical protein
VFSHEASVLMNHSCMIHHQPNSGTVLQWSFMVGE